MGMDPATATVVAAAIPAVLGFSGGLLQGDPNHPPESFANSNSTDPRVALADLLDMTKGAYRDASQRAQMPVELPSAYVQAPPTFAGGGLPMPIGVNGRDPAVNNPELKRIVGGQIGSWTPPTNSGSIFRQTTQSIPGGGNGGDNTDVTGKGPTVPNLPPGYRSLTGPPTSTMPKRRSLFDPNSGDGQDLTAMPPDMLQANGALELLRHAIGA